MVQTGAIAANALKQYDTAYGLWQAMPWKSIKYGGQQYQQALLETLRGMSNKTPLVDYYRCFYKEECFVPGNLHCLPKECRDALDYIEMGK